jgi:hypothetical protein
LLLYLVTAFALKKEAFASASFIILLTCSGLKILYIYSAASYLSKIVPFGINPISTSSL